MPENAESDVIFMSLVIFVPSVFALVLMLPGLFPRGREDWMRWWSLLGTAVTLVLSICMFISYYHDVIEFHGQNTDATSLSIRVDKAKETAAATKPAKSADW